MPRLNTKEACNCADKGREYSLQMLKTVIMDF